MFKEYWNKYMYVFCHTEFTTICVHRAGLFALLETGSPITATCVGLGNNLYPTPGVAGKPVPGWNCMYIPFCFIICQILGGSLQVYVFFSFTMLFGAFT